MICIQKDVTIATVKQEIKTVRFNCRFGVVLQGIEACVGLATFTNIVHANKFVERHKEEYLGDLIVVEL